ncbi:MAG: hypothetical protein KZQ85_10970 [Candidatus Thiodiazotropha sp. (ex Myrtea sp. 'scaly one' KF741663)]|nr:hypothetical protein [Candidatus Thiodiazotropha sp. (ex Myrtea sp. 'scaly one' KF741663)]
MKLLVAIFILLFSINIYAADTLGTIGRIHVHHDNGKVFFWINAETSNYASCATIQRYVIDSTTEPGKSTLSTILYLKATGQNVEIFGAGNCALHADSETAKIVAIP